MTTGTPAACACRAISFLAFAVLGSACESNSGGQGSAPNNVGVSAEVKADLASSKPTPPEPAKPTPQARAVPGQAQLDIAAGQLAEANARLNALGAGAAVEANAQTGNPGLKVTKPGARVDTKVEAGKPSLNIGKAGALIDAHVEAGKPSLNIGGLTKLKASASAGTQPDTK
jgi:hypothetical protein